MSQIRREVGFFRVTVHDDKIERSSSSSSSSSNCCYIALGLHEIRLVYANLD